MESDFFDSVIGEFGVHQPLCYFITADISNELVEVDARLGGNRSTDGTVVATNLFGNVARRNFRVARHAFELEQSQDLNVDLCHALRIEVIGVGFGHP